MTPRTHGTSGTTGALVATRNERTSGQLGQKIKYKCVKYEQFGTVTCSNESHISKSTQCSTDNESSYGIMKCNTVQMLSSNLLQLYGN